MPPTTTTAAPCPICELPPLGGTPHAFAFAGLFPSSACVCGQSAIPASQARLIDLLALYTVAKEIQAALPEMNGTIEEFRQAQPPEVQAVLTRFDRACAVGRSLVEDARHIQLSETIDSTS